MMSRCFRNSIWRSLLSGNAPFFSISSSIGLTLRGSIVSGVSPRKPKITAISLAWPLPVAPKEPNNSPFSRETFSNLPCDLSSKVKANAARIGPTVWELEGPMPTFNRSNTLKLIINALFLANPVG